MKIVMVRDARASRDGRTVEEFLNGETYEVTSELARYLVLAKSARYVDETPEDARAEAAETPEAPVKKKAGKK